MKLLNRDVDYAARALVYMARANKPTVAVVRMREEVGVTGPFLRKIMQKLQKAGFVHSVKGKGGGFALARRPENIRLGDLINALQGPVKFNECVFKQKLCQHHDACVLRTKIAGLESRLAAEMEGITVRDLI
ncbi:MAG: Rrf2 family transcriptional regulator [Elusimicrobia bacterium]|nr:Rrf2 family transcriptional regulator [Elusimicrobiota bacterium]MDA8244243.1 Rrf2 family transcriptional regulator [Elusimicrobiota bacterium]